MIEDRSEIVETLNNSKIARLATVDPENNQPYLVPVVFVFNGYNIFIPIDDKPKKTGNSNQLKRVKNIQKNPNISFLIDTYDDEDWNNLSYLMIQGKARIVVNRLKDIDTIKTAHSLLSEKYLQYKNLVGMGDSCIVIDIQKVIKWKYSN
ncbi:MAG: pyridoxamine 5'-phosphate oxidase family protein [Nitrososphaeraceae archaeon]|nr:pyridoxamine 5'-phosphate oxidase family protein [Nitrososphaeraceae archaeon]MDW3626787.1 pyridoxamine 5'-phosphate oxidase family protein [Nitrososphaeraceae archaeon]